MRATNVATAFRSRTRLITWRPLAALRPGGRLTPATSEPASTWLLSSFRAVSARFRVVRPGRSHGAAPVHVTPSPSGRACSIHEFKGLLKWFDFHITTRQRTRTAATNAPDALLEAALAELLEEIGPLLAQGGGIHLPGVGLSGIIAPAREPSCERLVQLRLFEEPT